MMDRLRLRGRIIVRGLTIDNECSELVIEPLQDLNDDRWMLRVGEMDVPITPLLFRVLGRTVGLVHSGCVVLKEFEHIAFLHALGLRGVRICISGSCWPPYMSSAELLRQLQVRSYVQGKLLPYSPQKFESEHLVEQRRRGDFSRRLDYLPDLGAHRLFIKILIDYGKGRDARHEFELPLDIRGKKIQKIAGARTFGRPYILRPVSWVVGALPLVRGRRWPHGDKVQWMPWGDCSAFLEEEAEHGMLDKMGIYSLAAPPGQYVTGTLTSYRASHGMDVALARRIYPH